MFENFNARARSVILLGAQEAYRANSQQIKPAQIVIGLMDEAGRLWLHILGEFGLTLAEFKKRVAIHISRTQKKSVEELAQLCLRTFREREQFKPPSMSPYMLEFVDDLIRKNLGFLGDISLEDLSLSSASNQVCRHAEEEAKELRHKKVGTGHLLAGLLHIEEDDAASVLREVGLTLRKVRMLLGQFSESDEYTVPKR